MNLPTTDVGKPPKRMRGKAMNKQMLERRIAEMGCDPVEGLAQISMNQVPCTACDEKHTTTKYQFLLFMNFDDPLLLEHASKSTERILCGMCAGTGTIQVPINERRFAYQALLDRMVPKLAAHKIEAEITRPVVTRAHAIDEEAEQRRVRGVMQFLDHIENVGETEQELRMEQFNAVLIGDSDE